MNAPARVLNLLHAARPEDIAPVLSLLSDAELAAGLASEHCDPPLRTVAPDREAVRQALLRLRWETGHLPAKPGVVRDTVRLTARHPYQRVLPDGITPYGRPRADLSRRLSAALTAALGTEAWRWYGVMGLVDKWSGSFTELLDEAAGWTSDAAVPLSLLRFRLPDELYLPGVLLALAPPAVVADVLVYTAQRSKGTLGGLLRQQPYHPAYLEHAFGPDGSGYARQMLCANPGKPLAVAHELLDRGVGAKNAARITAAHDDLALRLRVHRDPVAAAEPWPISNLHRTTPEQVHALLTAAETAEELHGLLVALEPLLRRIPKAGRVRVLAYRRLAELAGPEPVWSVELALAGGLDLLVHRAVRASMTGGGVAALVAAAEDAVRPGPPRRLPYQDSLTAWPVEDAVRRHLDGRLDRWRRILRSSDGETASALAIVQCATGQSVRPAGPGIEDLTRTTQTSARTRTPPTVQTPPPAATEAATESTAPSTTADPTATNGTTTAQKDAV